MFTSFDCVIIIVDTIANTVNSTVDTTKNAAATALEKGSSLVGAAKGNNNYVSPLNKTILLI